MKLKKYLILFMAYFAIVTIHSCTNESADIAAEPTPESTLRNVNSTATFDNNMLNFSTLKAAQEYIVELGAMIEAAEDRDAFLIQAMDESAGNTLMESKWGADLSLRDNMTFENGEEWKAYMKSEWLHDEAYMLMFNSDYEVGISDQIYVWFGEDQYHFDKANVPQRNAWLAEEKVGERPSHNMKMYNPTLISSERQIIIPDVDNDDDDWWDWPPTATERALPVLEVTNKLVDCTLAVQNLRSEFFLIYNKPGEGIGTYPARTDWFITLPDGGTAQMEDSEVIEFEYDFDSPGLHEIIYDLSFWDPELSARREIRITETINAGQDCTASRLETNEWDEIAGKVAMGSWLLFGHDAFGTRVKGGTKSFAWNILDNDWEKREAYVFVSAGGQLRLEENCTPFKEVGSVDEGYKKSITTSDHSDYGLWTATGDITSRHINEHPMNLGDLERFLSLSICD